MVYVLDAVLAVLVQWQMGVDVEAEVSVTRLDQEPPLHLRHRLLSLEEVIEVQRSRDAPIS